MPHGIQIGDYLYLLQLVGVYLCFFLSISNSVLIFYLVLKIPWFCIFLWPLSVAGAESGRCFLKFTCCEARPCRFFDF